MVQKKCFVLVKVNGLSDGCLPVQSAQIKKKGQNKASETKKGRGWTVGGAGTKRVVVSLGEGWEAGRDGRRGEVIGLRI